MASQRIAPRRHSGVTYRIRSDTGSCSHPPPSRNRKQRSSASEKPSAPVRKGKVSPIIVGWYSRRVVKRLANNFFASFARRSKLPRKLLGTTKLKRKKIIRLSRREIALYLSTSMCLASVTGIITRSTSDCDKFLFFIFFLSFFHLPKCALNNQKQVREHGREHAHARKIHVSSWRAGTVRARAAVLVDFCNHLRKRTGKHTLPATTHGRQTWYSCVQTCRSSYLPWRHLRRRLFTTADENFDTLPPLGVAIVTEATESVTVENAPEILLVVHARCWSKLF